MAKKYMANRYYYAARLKNGELYTRRGSGAPALFLTESKARQTLDMVPQYQEPGYYTIVRFSEV